MRLLRSSFVFSPPFLPLRQGRIVTPPFSPFSLLTTGKASAAFPPPPPLRPRTETGKRNSGREGPGFFFSFFPPPLLFSFFPPSLSTPWPPPLFPFCRPERSLPLKNSIVLFFFLFFFFFFFLRALYGAPQKNGGPPTFFPFSCSPSSGTGQKLDGAGCDTFLPFFFFSPSPPLAPRPSLPG